MRASLTKHAFPTPVFAPHSNFSRHRKAHVEAYDRLCGHRHLSYCQSGIGDVTFASLRDVAAPFELAKSKPRKSKRGAGRKSQQCPTRMLGNSSVLIGRRRPWPAEAQTHPLPSSDQRSDIRSPASDRVYTKATWVLDRIALDHARIGTGAAGTLVSTTRS